MHDIHRSTEIQVKHRESFTIDSYYVCYVDYLSCFNHIGLTGYIISIEELV